MRLIIILFLGITVVSLVLKYLTPSVLSGASERAVEASTGIPGSEELDRAFLPPPPTGSEDLSNRVRIDDVEVQQVERMRSTPYLRDSPDLAGALLHLEPEGFQQVLEARFPDINPERQRLLVSFSLAIAERPEKALALADNILPSDFISSGEYALLQSAITGEPHGAMPTLTGHPGSVQMAMSLALLGREGERLLQQRQWKLAAETLSTLLLEDLRAPWVSHQAFTETWATLLNTAQSNHRWLPSGTWRAIDLEVQPGDSLSLIRSRAIDAVEGLKICTGLIGAVNGIGDRYLQVGETLRVPTDPVSTLVDLEARFFFYFFGEEIAYAWPVAIGAPGSETPRGDFMVGELIHEPAWFRPGMSMIPYGDPKNELGTHWIGWNGLGGESTHYGFHGTWEPDTVGTAVSDGCVRLRNEDVARMYRILPRGTSIRIQM